MAELLEWLARRLVDEPEAVRVETEEREGAMVFHLHVAPDDVGKVIGSKAGSRGLSAASSARAAPGRTSVTSSRLPTDPEHELVGVGRVGRPHGLDGAFVVEHGSEEPGRFDIGAELLVDGVPARVEISRQVGGARTRSSSTGPSREAPSSPCAETRSHRSRRTPTTSPTSSGSTSWTRATCGSGSFETCCPGPPTTCSSSTRALLLPLVEDCVREVDLAGRRILLNPGFIG